MKNTLQADPYRIDVADVLRGFAIMGIIILHSVEHFNFYSFPDTQPAAWFAFTDRVIWDGLFFMFGGKCYAIFALLFGFSFFIQDDNQRRRGGDFRGRFLWRLLLLFIIGNVNASFFTGEILVMYALLGVTLAAVCRLPDRAVFWIGLVCMLQPVDLIKTVYGLLNPTAPAAGEMAAYYFNEAFKVQSTGTFLETVRMNIWTGQLANFSWAWEHGRIFQTVGLFMFGLLAGRRRYFVNGDGRLRTWLKVFGWALAAYFPLVGLQNLLPAFIESPLAVQSLTGALQSFSNLAFMLLMLNGILIFYYYSRLHGVLHKLAPYGKLSLTHYLGQSVIGSLLFYRWGFNLQLGITYSFFVGIALFAAQYAFTIWWLRGHKHGPFEGLWKKLTWIGAKR